MPLRTHVPESRRNTVPGVTAPPFPKKLKNWNRAVPVNNVELAASNARVSTEVRSPCPTTFHVAPILVISYNG